MSGNGALGPGEVVFFLHIPKTGGVTFSERIDANFEPDEILPVPDPEDGLKMFRELSPARLASIRCARGHFWFGPGDRGVYDFLTPDPAIVTLLRNPIDRAVSVFQFALANPEIWLAKRLMRPEASLSEFAEHPIEDGEIRALRAMTLEDFVCDPLAQGELENLQARFVVGRVPGNAFSTTPGGYMPEQRLPDDELLRRAKTRLEEFAFVGLTERLDESVAMLARRFGWPVPEQIPRLNASPRPSRHYPVSAAARKAILDRAAVDVELHEHARGLFDARLAESRSSVQILMPNRPRTEISKHDLAAARELVDSVENWFHQIEIAPGLVTPGTQNSAAMLAAINLPDDLSGQRILDIGTRDGFFAFECERRGGAVTAVDYVDPGVTGFLVARDLLGSSVEFVQDNVYNLSPERYGKFDLVLFLGVLYHLRNPLLALDTIREVARGSLILETHLIDDAFLTGPGQFRRLAEHDPELESASLMQFYPAGALNDDPTNVWAPNETCLKGMLEAAGFKVESMLRMGQRGIAFANRMDDSALGPWRALDRSVGMWRATAAEDPDTPSR